MSFSFLESAGSVADHYRDHYRLMTILLSKCCLCLGDKCVVEEHLESQITLKMLTDYTGYSPSHFSMLFKQKTGQSPLSYFNLLKIQQACFMLDKTNMKVNQISAKLGINDAYYFSRLFCKIMGMSPKEYRAKKKG